MNQHYDEQEKYYISLAVQSDKTSISEVFSLPIKYLSVMVDIINEINEKRKQEMNG